MSAERGTNCTVAGCGRARSASVHIKGGGAFTHEWQRAPKARKRPVYMGRSEQGAANADQWALDKENHLAEHPDCELAGFLAGKCAGVVEAHHVQPRSAGSTQYDDGPLISVCRLHHSALESKRSLARVLGLLERRELPPELRSLVDIPDPAYPTREVSA